MATRRSSAWWLPTLASGASALATTDWLCVGIAAILRRSACALHPARRGVVLRSLRAPLNFGLACHSTDATV
jgi:hypothetical protein